jgi:predicted dithiol-disulfide oxidoreductase (DUF899 family)
MNYNEAAGMLAEYRNQIAGIREKMRNAQASIEPEEVKDYEFVTPQGKARLSTLFGDKDTLFIIHSKPLISIGSPSRRLFLSRLRA